LCPQCGTNILSTQNIVKRNGIHICSNCRNNIKLSECELSYYCGEKIPTPYDFLETYNNIGLITKKYYGICPRCKKAEIIPFSKYPSDSSVDTKGILDYFYCSNCKELFEISSFYKIADKKILDLWSSGLWLEWYVKKLCEKCFPKSIVKQGLLLKFNKDVLDVDVLLFKNNKSYGIECKSLSPLKSADWGDISNVIKYSAYVDVSILACTGKLQNIDKRTLKEKGIKIVENNNIEKIGSILKKNS